MPLAGEGWPDDSPVDFSVFRGNKKYPNILHLPPRQPFPFLFAVSKGRFSLISTLKTFWAIQKRAGCLIFPALSVYDYSFEFYLNNEVFPLSTLLLNGVSFSMSLACVDYN